jgi:hypothetical protein
MRRGGRNCKSRYKLTASIEMEGEGLLAAA